MFKPVWPHVRHYVQSEYFAFRCSLQLYCTQNKSFPYGFYFRWRNNVIILFKNPGGQVWRAIRDTWVWLKRKSLSLFPSRSLIQFQWNVILAVPKIELFISYILYKYKWIMKTTTRYPILLLWDFSCKHLKLSLIEIWLYKTKLKI